MKTAAQAKRSLNQEMLGRRAPAAPPTTLDANAIRALLLSSTPVEIVLPPREEQVPPAGYEKVGIVFVHGVGSQRAGDTVREYGTALVDFLEEWHTQNEVPGFSVNWAELTSRERDAPAAASVRIPAWTPDPDDPDAGHPPQDWVIAEAWWAARLEPPPLPTMLGWALRRYGRVITGLMTSCARSISAPPHRGPLFALTKLVNALAILMVYGLAELAILALLILVSAASILPLKPIQDFVATRLVRGLLVDNLGDFYVCMYDRIQAVNVRQSLYHTVNWLIDTAGCTRILVAAHSGGTVVATEALGTAELDAIPDLPDSLPRKIRLVRTLVTFGASNNRGWDEASHGTELRSARALPKDLWSPETTWLDFWTPFDWAAGGRGLTHGPARTGMRGSLLVTNGLSPVSDHGTYIANHEEFMSRIAQEADRPSDGLDPDRYMESRFWPGRDRDDLAPHVERVRRRYDRIAMLTMWRASALVAALAALIGRYVVQPRSIVADGEWLWQALSKFPALGAFVGGPGALLGGAGTLTKGLPSAPDVITLLVAFLDAAVNALAALAFVGAVMVGVYAFWSAQLFGAWNEKMSRASARWALPDQAQEMRITTVLLLAMLAALAFAITVAPPFARIPDVIGKVLGLG